VLKVHAHQEPCITADDHCGLGGDMPPWNAPSLSFWFLYLDEVVHLFFGLF